MSQRIQFDGRECVVISPEDYDAYKSLQSQLAALEADNARCIDEKSVMLKAMEDARRAMAYSYKFDPVMEIAYLKLDNSICAVKPTKEG